MTRTLITAAGLALLLTGCATASEQATGPVSFTPKGERKPWILDYDAHATQAAGQPFASISATVNGRFACMVWIGASSPHQSCGKEIDGHALQMTCRASGYGSADCSVFVDGEKAATF